MPSVCCGGKNKIWLQLFSAHPPLSYREQGQSEVRERNGRFMDQLEEEFNLLYDGTYEALRRFVLGRCASVSEAEDILQTVNMELYRHRRKGAVIRRPEAYLYAVARHELTRQYGWAALRRRQTDSLTAAQIWRQIRELDPLTYRIFMLYFCQDCTLAQIADRLDCKESLVKSRLYRALKRFRED